MTKRRITPHKGGRTASAPNARIRPQTLATIKATMQKRKASFADLLEETYSGGNEMKPQNTRDAVENFAGFNPQDAISAKMTDKQIREYFTKKNFAFMFSGDSDISDWPCTYSDMADCAIELVNEARKQQ